MLHCNHIKLKILLYTVLSCEPWKTLHNTASHYMNTAQQGQNKANKGLTLGISVQRILQRSADYSAVQRGAAYRALLHCTLLYFMAVKSELPCTVPG